jgi:hypothetical protein
MDHASIRGYVPHMTELARGVHRCVQRPGRPQRTFPSRLARTHGPLEMELGL